MRKMRFMLEYNCIPIWLYESDGDLIGPGIPDEMANDHEFVELINEIKEQFDGLYENNAVNFEYLGFRNANEKQTFFAKISKAIECLKSKVSNNYLLQIELDESNY